MFSWFFRVHFALLLLLMWGLCLPSMAAESFDSGLVEAQTDDQRLPVLLHPIEGELAPETAVKLKRSLEDALFQYPDLMVYTREEFLRQIGWQRQQGKLVCQLPEDCMALYKERVGIRHDILLQVALRADGQYNLRLKMSMGPRWREIVETIPEFSAAPVVLEKIVPDLLGLPNGIRLEEGALRVSSFPLHAEVRLNDAVLCRTPCSLTAQDGRELALSVRREGHPAVFESIRIAKGEVRRWFADLVTRQGEILVDSVPAGASIFLDGKRMGVTPDILRNVIVGQHNIQLSMPPYPETLLKVDVPPNGVARIRHEFRPEQGRLVVNCSNKEKKKNVEIFLNDRKVSENTYTADLPPGNYTVTLVQSGYATREERVTVLADEETRLDLTLEKGLALRPGQQVAETPDYRPGAFTTVISALLVGFGAFLEVEAQNHYDNANSLALDDPDRDDERSLGKKSRIAGGVLMGVGSAGMIAGVVLLILPPMQHVAVTPTIDPATGTSGVKVSWRF